MKIDKETVDQITSLGDDEIRAKLGAVLDAIGLDGRRKKKLLDDIPNLKREFGAMSQKDLDKISSKISGKTAEELSEKLKNEFGGNNNG